MANATNIVVTNDDLTTTTLVPVFSSGVSNGAFTVQFRELSATKPVSACMRASVTSEILKSGVVKITRIYEIPVMEIIPAGSVNSDGRTASPEVAHTLKRVVTDFYSPRSNATERANLARVANNVELGGHVSGTILSPSTGAANLYRDVAAAYQVVYGIVNYVWPSA